MKKRGVFPVSALVVLACVAIHSPAVAQRGTPIGIHASSHRGQPSTPRTWRDGKLSDYPQLRTDAGLDSIQASGIPEGIIGGVVGGIVGATFGYTFVASLCDSNCSVAGGAYIGAAIGIAIGIGCEWLIRRA